MRWLRKSKIYLMIYEDVQIINPKATSKIKMLLFQSQLKIVIGNLNNKLYSFLTFGKYILNNNKNYTS